MDLAPHVGMYLGLVEEVLSWEVLRKGLPEWGKIVSSS
jgi:hypothetical protein